MIVWVYNTERSVERAPACGLPAMVVNDDA